MQMNSEPTMIGAMPDAGRTQALSTPGEVTQMGAPVECPVCRSRNLASEVYCSECGFMLAGTPDTTVEPDVPESPAAIFTDTRTNQKYPLQPGKYSVGRENADILLTDGSVSRSHAEIEVRKSDVLVTDLGSTNGTIAAGQRLGANQPATLHGGQEVRFGSCVLTLAMDTTAEAEEAVIAPEAPEPVEQISVEPTCEVEDRLVATCSLGDADIEAEAPKPDACSLADETAELSDAFDESPVAEVAVVEELVTGAYLEDKENPTVRYPISEEGANIGRKAGNDVVIANSYVSSSHAQIAVQSGSYILMDTGSTNGTTLNGSKLAPNDPRIIDPGDEIAFGPLTFVFRVSAL